MSEQINISIKEIEKSDIAVCPECGVIFVKSIKGDEWGLLLKNGYYCPVCETLTATYK